MSKHAFLLTILIALTCTCSVQAQDSVAERTQSLIAQLDKTKHKKKDKGNVHIEVFVEIKHRPTPEGEIRDFSGKYATDQTADYRMDIQVASDGTVTGKGYDLIGFQQEREDYTLRDARVTGNLLTGTRVFADRSEPFEAVFVIQTERTGTNPADAKVVHQSQGIAFIQRSKNWTTRVFLQKLGR